MIEKIKVGITGGIGSGKSLVCHILETMGYEVFYSDKVAKDLVTNSLEIKTEIISILGENAYDLNGQYNSKYISEIVFKLFTRKFVRSLSILSLVQILRLFLTRLQFCMKQGGMKILIKSF